MRIVDENDQLTQPIIAGSCLEHVAEGQSTEGCVAAGTLLPHLSHNDGKKIDVSLIYENPNGELTNRKRSISGYGAYESPTEKEYDQISVCKSKGNWQYDFPKYLTLGKINKNITFSKKGTHDLSNLIVKQNEIGKLFIEPHLKNRLNLKSDKVRFHGCQAVRHDDHIHFQLK